MLKTYRAPELPNKGGVSQIYGIAHAEPEAPNEGACLRCDEPPVLLQLRLQMGGCPPCLKLCERALANVVPVPSRTLFGHLPLVVTSQAHNSYETLQSPS